MLEPDQTEILVDIVIQYFNNVGNQPRSNFTRPDFEPSFEAISINCLLFSSLGASLVAALASVVALQWVADYDAAITRGGSSPEDRAKRRQFRHAGVIGWKMGEIIAALPILLYSSVILFWAGAIQWMWTLHHTVGCVVAGGTAIAVLFYASTTVLAAAYVSAPFRTPLSRGLYWAMGPSASTIYRVFSLFPFKNILRRVALPFRDARFPSFFRGSIVFQWIKKHILPERTSRYREDKAAEQDPSIASEALAWLAQQLPLSTDSHERLLLWVHGITALFTEISPSPRFHDAPWLAILDLLSEHFLRKILDPISTEKDYEGVGILLHCINTPFIRSKVVPDASYIRDPEAAHYWGQCCLVVNGNLNLEAIKHAPLSFLLARDMPVPSLGSKYELEATWKLIRWRNSINVTITRPNYRLCSNDIWPEVFSDIGRYSPEFFESCLRHFGLWTIIRRSSFLSGLPNYAVIFNSVAEQALGRDLTISEVLALVRAFAESLTASLRYILPETVDEANIISRPLLYAWAVGQSSEPTRATHFAITLLIVRAAARLSVTEQQEWVRWIILMLWIASPREPGDLDALRKMMKKKGTPSIWDVIDMSSTNEAVQGAHVGEIGQILWHADNAMMESLTRDAFKDLQSLASDVHLLSILLTPNRGIWSSCFNGFLTATDITRARNIYCSTSTNAHEMIIGEPYMQASIQYRLASRVSIGRPRDLTLYWLCLLCPIPRMWHACALAEK
jgi:hypothetical protein